MKHKHLLLSGKYFQIFFIWIFYLLFFLNTKIAFGQDPASYIRQNAIKIESPEILNDSIYELLKPYKCMLVGEMHGTNEPAQFAGGLIDLFTSHGDSVVFGIEIPSDYMKEFIKLKTDSSVFHSDFFANPPFHDGRQSVAWARLISKAVNNPMVSVFFLDINTAEKDDMSRDYHMFLKVKERLMANPHHRVITLGGNFHNASNSPDKNSMGYYLANDSLIEKQGGVFSFNLYYNHGQIRVDSGNGLELKEMDRGDDIFTQTLAWDYFVMKANPIRNYSYTGIFFSRQITASKMVDELK